MINDLSWSLVYDAHLSDGSTIRQTEQRAMDESEFGAVVGGSVVGGIILLVVAAVVIHLVCVKTKRRHREETKKHHPSPQGLSPNHSQPSTLSQDVQFPKVSHNGLWLPAPGMHAVSPSPAYHMHKNGPTPMIDAQPSYLQRATSERRPQSRLPYSPQKPMFASHSNVYLMPVHGAQRIYHSSNLGALHEVPPMMASYGPMEMEIYEYAPMGVHHNGLASRSKLIETKHSPYMYDGNFMIGGKMGRSYSDAHSLPKPTPHKFNRPISTTLSNDNKSQSAFKDSSVYIKDNQRKLVTSDGLNGKLQNKASPEEVHSSYYNKAFSADSGLGKSSTSIDKPNVPHLIAMKSPKRISQSNGTLGLVWTYVSKTDFTDIPGPATDSRSILGNNKTDDQKTQPSFSDVLDSIDLPQVETDLGHIEYNYRGSLVSQKLEKPHAITKSSTSSTDSGAYSEGSAPSKSKNSDRTESKEIAKNDYVIRDIVDTLVLPGSSSNEKPNSSNLPFGNSQTRVSVRDTGKVNSELKHNSAHSEDKKPKEIKVSTKTSVDGAFDAGKITDSAFEFLDSYLSEDEGTDNQMESLQLARMAVEMKA